LEHICNLIATYTSIALLLTKLKKKTIIGKPVNRWGSIMPVDFSQKFVRLRHTPVSFSISYKHFMKLNVDPKHVKQH